MADLVKSVLGATGSLIIGWILPVFVSLQAISFLILPELSHNKFIATLLRQSATSRQLTFLAIAAVSGLVLAAIQAPLYRVLEGYVLWPRKIADHRIKKHQARRRKLLEEYNTVAQTSRGVRAGLLYERAARYPVKDKQFAPTALGNAIRRFETYAGDRYQLDSQLLWHNLTAAAPERAITSLDNARTNVDFFVCFFYGGVLIAALGAGVTSSSARGIRSLLAIAVGTLIAIVCYQLAIVVTDEWSAAVRALVDNGRKEVASSFGLTIPANFEDERYMWRAVNTLVRRPYDYSESRDPSVASILSRFRAYDANEATIEHVTPGTDSLSSSRSHQAVHTALHIVGSVGLVLAILAVRSRFKWGSKSGRS